MHCSGVYSERLEENDQKVERLHSVTGLDQVNVLHFLEKFEEALTLVDQFLSQNLTDYERGWALLKKGTILTRLERPNEALEIYEEIEKTYAPSDQIGMLMSSVHYERSKALSKIGKQDRAIDALFEAIELTKQARYGSFDKEFRVEQMSIRMGRYLLLAGRPDDALNAFKTTIGHLEALLQRKNSRSMERLMHCELSVAYKEMVEVYVHQGEMTSAIDTCKKALEYAEKEKSNFPEHPWILQIKDRLANLQENN
jgi:tetratricopeptide (TPR) repeat protein